VSDSATIVSAPPGNPPMRSTGPGDDYLIALAHARRAALVCGDKHPLRLSKEIPVSSRRDLLTLLTDA